MGGQPFNGTVDSIADSNCEMLVLMKIGSLPGRV